MRFSEFSTIKESAGGTCSGGIATVATPIGPMQTRSGGSFFSGKYTNDSFPNTPDWIKKTKKKRK